MCKKPSASKFSHVDPEVLKSLIFGTREGIQQALKALAEGGMSAAVVTADDLLPPISLPPDAVIEVKITLRGFRPAVTRTVAVHDMTLGDLHSVIQIAMGWTNSHLHEFQVRGTDLRFGEIPLGNDPFEMDFGEQWKDEENVRLGQLVMADRRRLIYTYDFGDCWEHDILLSKPKTPKAGLTCPCCLKGALAGPPEDCGGIWGYCDLLDALQIPVSERSEDECERLEWLDGFDPEEFDPASVTKQLQKTFRPPKPRSGAQKQASKRSVKPKT